MLPLDEHARSCLLIVDMQEFYFLDPALRRAAADVIANINRLSAGFDARALPVFHVISGYHADGSDWELKMKAAGVPECILGTPEAAILAEIHTAPGHHTLVKTRYSGFFKTDLAQRLRVLDVARAVVVGAFTHYCVNATVFDAYCHDFVPGMVTDAVFSHRPAESEVLVERMRRNGYHLFTTQELLDQLAE